MTNGKFHNRLLWRETAPHVPALSPSLIDYSRLLVPQLLALQAANAPDRLALNVDGKLMTHGELTRRANHLADALVSRGVTPGSIVALHAEQCATLAISALAAWKAGAAYVPLDPLYPADRLESIVTDCHPAAVITEKRFLPRFRNRKYPLLTCDGASRSFASRPKAVANYAVRPEDIAYVIYTSGSTGRPKGVKISHGNLRQLVAWHNTAFTIEACDRMSQIASLGFDAAVWEIWPALGAGASLHSPSAALRRDPIALRDWLLANEITICFIPTPLAEYMIDLEWPPNGPLRIMLTGADILHKRPPSSLPFALINNYGPTECTVVATSGVVASDGKPGALPSIGRPIAGVSIYILDDQMRQVADGTAGEICIGGALVGSGYLNDPELTAARFLEWLGADGTTQRIYRTGDKGCYLPDGEISFLGRLDQQVKIRGYRIEPAEIVARLSEHPSVLASAVAVGQANGENRLTGYVVLMPNAAVGAAEMRAFLQDKLPTYMIPPTFVRLESLPLTVNGKIDYTSLPEPDATNVLAEAPSCQHSNPIEKRVAEMLAAVLNLEHVNTRDNFFLLGGHSLLAAQLIAAIRGTFDLDLSLRVIFDHPTAKDLAAEIARGLAERVNSMTADELERALMEQN